MSSPAVTPIQPGVFEASSHYYPRVPNAMLHPLVRHFLTLGNARIAQRFCHLHPEVDRAAVTAALAGSPKWFRWAGADLLVTTTDRGDRGLVVVEVNSCPSGQKSMPLRDEDDEHGGYRTLLERSFLPLLERRAARRDGVLAVLWDKNAMETAGYAGALADLTGEPVSLVYAPARTEDPALRFEDGWLSIRDPSGSWQPVRAAFRYVTEKPWTRIPPLTRTPIFNPVLVCLAGGRNKMLAAKAYDFHNAAMAATGLSIRTPDTIWDVPREEVPLWVARMGGVAVVKNPYSNAGQGVYTIVNDAELEAFMALEQSYDRFIVQALIGNVGWSSRTRSGRLYHVGTVPNRKGRLYAFDIRFMVGADASGFYPIGIYARRARTPLSETVDGGTNSWQMLGTNLSVRGPDGGWATEPERLMLMDSRDFNHLGLGLDDLTEAYLQTVLSVGAIDTMASRLVTKKGAFRRRFFQSVNPDPALAREIS